MVFSVTGINMASLSINFLPSCLSVYSYVSACVSHPHQLALSLRVSVCVCVCVCVWVFLYLSVCVCVCVCDIAVCQLLSPTYRQTDRQTHRHADEA